MQCILTTVQFCIQGYFAEQDEGATPTSPMDTTEQVEEKLAFALGDGRVGILAVKGRKVRCTATLIVHMHQRYGICWVINLKSDIAK